MTRRGGWEIHRRRKAPRHEWYALVVALAIIGYLVWRMLS